MINRFGTWLYRTLSFHVVICTLVISLTTSGLRAEPTASNSAPSSPVSSSGAPESEASSAIISRKTAIEHLITIAQKQFADYDRCTAQLKINAKATDPTYIQWKRADEKLLVTIAELGDLRAKEAVQLLLANDDVIDPTAHDWSIRAKFPVAKALIEIGADYDTLNAIVEKVSSVQWDEGKQILPNSGKDSRTVISCTLAISQMIGTPATIALVQARINNEGADAKKDSLKRWLPYLSKIPDGQVN